MPTLLLKENYKRATWKNGLGFTDEIAIHPTDASLIQGNFLWRLSSARIEKASPFSVFPNHDRILIILKGAGVKLIHTFEEGGEEEVVEIPVLEPYEFPGDVPSRCELLDGGITDFSIFIRKGEVEPMVQMEEVQNGENYTWNAVGKWNFAFVISGKFNTSLGLLNEGNTLSTEQGSIALESLNQGSRLLLISLG